jgi:uncharacterized protein with FMN-binding domain
MHRALPVLAATAGGLALLARFHTSPEPVPRAAALTDPSTIAPSTTAGAPPGAPPATGTAPTTTTAPPPGAETTVPGPVIATFYGDVQVQVTVQGHRLADVKALQLPSDRSRSRSISSAAGPILRGEALTAQSANIDIVSGASFTSEGYAESLQGALDRAGW